MVFVLYSMLLNLSVIYLSWENMSKHLKDMDMNSNSNKSDFLCYDTTHERKVPMPSKLHSIIQHDSKLYIKL